MSRWAKTTSHDASFSGDHPWKPAKSSTSAGPAAPQTPHVSPTRRGRLPRMMLEERQHTPEQPLPAPTQTHLQEPTSAPPGFGVGSCSHVWWDSAGERPHPPAEASLIPRGPHPPPLSQAQPALATATPLSLPSEPREPRESREPHDHQAAAGSSRWQLCSLPGTGLAPGRTSSSQGPAPTVLKEKSPHPFMGCFC